MGIGSANPLLLASAASGGDSGGSTPPPSSDPVTRSLRLDGSSSRLSKTFSSAGNRKTYTFSCWIKKAEQGENSSIFDSGGNDQLRFTSSDVLRFVFNNSNQLETAAKFRDPSGWMSIVLAVDTTQSTSTDRVKIWVNGTLQTLTGSYPSQDATGNINNAATHEIGRLASGSYYYGGYIADAYFIDGEAKSPTDFIESNNYGGYKPKAYTGSFGTNGFHLKFDDSSDIGADDAGSNDFTATNLSSHDVMLDTPTKNYATLNPLERTGTRDSVSEGNLKTTHLTTSGWGYISSTMGLPSGKWVWAVRMNSQGGGIPTVGFHKTDNRNFTSGSATSLGYSSTDSWAALYTQSGYQTTLYNGSSNTTSLDIGNFTNGDRMVVAVDIDAGKAWWGKFDGTTLTWHNSGNPANGTNATATFTAGTAMTPAVSCYNNYGSATCNFGQDATYAGEESPSTTYADSEGNGSFDFQPPSGFLAVCSDNLDAPTVTPSEHFGVLTYNGNSDLYNGSGSTQNVTGVNFDVGMAWIKDRDNNSSGYTNSGSDEYGHYLFDTVTGTSTGGYNLDGDVVSSGSGPYLNSGEYGVTSFSAGSGTSRGITVDEAGETNFDYDDGYYQLTERYVAWLWKLGSTGSSSTWNSSYTAPNTEHYNASAGVTAIEVSPASSGNLEVAHSLSAAPEFFFVGTDSYGDFSGYPAFHKDLDSEKYLQLDGSSAQSSDSTYFPSGAAHADYIKLGSVFADSYSYGNNLRIWAFTGVEGYSKFGKYTGNGSANGPFIYTGFRPRFLMVKRLNSSAPWKIRDAKRDPYNVASKNLDADSSGSEGDYTSNNIDLLSNGFKWRTSGSHENHNGHDYIYAAFSESPFSKSNAR